MCTVTWRFTPDSGGWALDLGFNRDERRDRPLAQPPRVRRPEAGLPFIAPRDPAGGGSWLALNTAGLCLGLLNLYEAEAGVPDRDASFSRGRLVWQLAGSQEVGQVREGLQRILERERLRPFQLLVAQGGALRRVDLWRWDGRALLESDLMAEVPLLSSSSHRPAAVVAGRRMLHDAVAGPAGLASADRFVFHRSHLPRRGPWSVCMHRPDARTVSYSQLRASGSGISFRYAAGAPCRSALGPALRLEPGG